MVTKPALDVAVQVQPAWVTTEMPVFDPAAGIVPVVEATVKVQPVVVPAACGTETLCWPSAPVMVTVPVRVAPVLASTVMSTFPSPVPEVPLTMWIHGVAVVDVHVHVFGLTSTLIPVFDPAAGIVPVVDGTVRTHVGWGPTFTVTDALAEPALLLQLMVNVAVLVSAPVGKLPETVRVPLQPVDPPEPTHVVAFCELQRTVVASL